MAIMTPKNGDDGEGTRVNRRSVLRSLGATSSIGLIGTLPSTTAQGKEKFSQKFKSEIKNIKNKLDVEELSGRQKRRLVERVRNEEEVQAIKNQLESEGAYLALNEADALRSRYYGENSTIEYETVALPFTGTEDNIVIIWSSYEGIETIGYRFIETTVKSNNQSGKNSVGSAREIETTFTSYVVERGQVVVRDQTDREKLGAAQTSTHQYEPKWICTPVYVCTGDIDLRCIVKTAATGVAGSPICNACVGDPTKATCIPCAALLIASGLSLDSCCEGGIWECTFCCP